MNNAANRSFLSRLAFALLWASIFVFPLAGVTEIPFVAMITKTVAILAMVAGCVAAVEAQEIRVPGPLIGVLAGFMAWFAVSVCWNAPHTVMIERGTICFQLFIMALLIWQFCKQEKDVLKLMDAFVLGSILPSLATIKAFLPGQVALFERAAAPKYDPSALAFLLALSLPISLYLTLRETGVRTALYRVNLGVSLTAVLLTGAPAVIIAAVTGATVAFLTMARVPAYKRAMLAISMGALLCVIGSFLPSGFLQRTVLPALTLEKLSGLAGTGIIGFCCFIALFGLSLFTAERMAGTTRSLWLALLAVWLIGACTLSWESSQPAWLLFGLLAAHAASGKKLGATEAERALQQNVYIEEASQAWS